MVAAQQRISGLIQPLMVGGVFFARAVFLLWVERPIRWYNVAIGLWLCMGSGLVVAVGINGWRPGGRALVFAPSGIQWNRIQSSTGRFGNPFRSGVVCIRWDDIANAPFVRWKNREDDEQVAVNPRQPDPVFRAEAAAAETLGIPFGVVSYEALVNENDPTEAVRRIPRQANMTVAIYRGWMLTPEKYRLLFDALLERGVQLVNDVAAYRHCHYRPESYSVIEQHTPKSVWITTTGDVSLDEIMDLLRPFGSAPVIVKDFVKSRKHEWAEACFIPSSSDRASVERVVRRFLDLQGDDLNEGLVFREFVEFEPLAEHPKSGMPLTKEFRLFFLEGKPIFWIPYWDEGNYGELTPPVERFAPVAQDLQSRYFTMDVAKRRDGDWLIVELGDGQVAGLPENADVVGFYTALRDMWPA